MRNGKKGLEETGFTKVRAQGEIMDGLRTALRNTAGIPLIYQPARVRSSVAGGHDATRVRYF